jgi:predicted alpha/beta hydrolase
MRDENPQIVEYCASDGVRASFRLFAASDPNAADVICLPAMGVRGRYYSDFARLMSKSGFHVLTSDLRGIDSSSVRASRHCDFGYEEIINRDLPALVEAAQLRFPSNERLPILAISFELDKFAPRKSVENFLCKLASSSVTHRHFEADDEALARAGHFDWTKRAGAIVAAVRNWADAEPIAE